jgi:Flp pilus assembly protein TadD
LFAPAAASYGIILCQRGQCAAADIELRKALSLEPDFIVTLYWLGVLRAASGSYSEAKPFLERTARASPNSPGVLGSLAYVYAREGKRAAADSIVATLRARATDDRGRANLAFAYAALGRTDAAFVLLRQLDWDLPSVLTLRADPLLKSLRSDPRYAQLLAMIAAEPTREAVR